MFLAYKYVGLAILLAEANFNAEKLNLPIQRPIQESQLTHKFVPSVARSRTFSGRIDAEGYSFSVDDDDHFRCVIKLDRDGYAAYPYGWLPMGDRNEKLSHEKSLITTNDAYQLAVGWLRAIDVDVHELEKTNKVEVRQHCFLSRTQAATIVLLPLFDVRWGKWDDPKVDVSIDGRTKEFIELRQKDGSFSRRPPDLISYVDELLAIPDEEFLSYTPLQKSNLVARFAMNWPTPRQRLDYLAYKYVGLAVLLAEANFEAERLNLPIQRPIQESQLRRKLVLDPAIYRNFGGRVDAGGYAFSERDRSLARMVTDMSGYGKTPEGEDLLRSKSLITTNEAYHLAAGWLRAIDVDVEGLERTSRVEVQQETWVLGGTQVLTPLFDVRWGKWEEPKVSVIVDGRRRKLKQLKQNDTSFSKRPAQLLRNAAELLAIPDEEFQNYTLLQRSNLITRFSANRP